MNGCTDDQLKQRYFPCFCEECGWRGCSCDCDGGNQIADTGDYDDILCPVCGSPEIEDYDE